MALLFNPVRRDELFDSGTGKIKEALIPDIAAVGAAADITFDPTGLTNITGTDLQAVIEQIDPLLGGGGAGESSIYRRVINYTQLANLPDYIGQWIQVDNLFSDFSNILNKTNKVNVKLQFNATNSITVDLKLTSNGTTLTYFDGFNTVNAEATFNLTTGINSIDFITDKLIDIPATNPIIISMKVNNANLADTLKILSEFKPVTLITETPYNTSLPPGV